MAKANIGLTEVRKRLVMGLISLVAAVAVGIWLISRGSNPMLWVAVFLLFWLAALGLFQAREKT